MICENCGKEHDGSYASGRFCCKECARAFSTKNENKHDTKLLKCIDCGKICCVNKRTNNKYRCKNCKDYYLLNQDKNVGIFTCKICGRKYTKYSSGCKNEFCKTHKFLGFNNLIKYFGFNKNKLGTIEVETEFNRVREIIYDLYINQRLSSSDISNMFGVESKHCLTQTTFKFLGIPIKNYKETSKDAYLNGKIKQQEVYNQYKSGKHITWDGKNVFLRSSYEFDFATKLDEEHILYEVEHLRVKYFDSVKLEYCTAVPDFYLPESNTIVEIKSDYTLNIQNMKDKFAAYKNLGYNTRLILNKKEVDLYSL